MRAIRTTLLVVLSACASSQNVSSARPASETVRISGPGGGDLTVNTTSDPPAVHTLSAPIERVWRSLPAIYDSLGVPVSVFDPATHQIGSGGYKLRRQLGGVPLSRYMDCGETQIGPNADSYDIYLVVLTTLQSTADGSTTATTLFQSSARPIAYSREYTRCSTKGVFEAKLFAAMGKGTLVIR